MYFRTTATPNDPSNYLIFYCTDAAEQDQNLEAAIKNAFAPFIDDLSIIHNYYLCKSRKCSKISQHDCDQITKDKKFQHKSLFDQSLALCEHTGIWRLTYIDGLGMFCSVYRMNDDVQLSNDLKVWNSEPNVRYQTETVKGHFAASSNVQTMHGIAVTTKKMKAAYFLEKERKIDGEINVVYEKIIRPMYWLAKEDNAVSKFLSLLNLLESIGCEDLSLFETRSSYIL